MDHANDSAHLHVIVPGQQVYLGPIRRDLVPVYQRWMNDLEVSRTLTAHWRVPFTLEDELDWFEQARRDPFRRIFTIYERPDDRPVGNAELLGIDFAVGSAEVGIVIGERSVWGRGYATEALRLLLDFGFTVLGLHHIWLRYFASNQRARAVYDRVGFREVNRLREATRIGPDRDDIVIMDLLASEFESPVLAKKIRPRPVAS